MRSIFLLFAEVKSTETKATAIRAQMMTMVSKWDLYRQLHRRKGREQVWTDR